MPYTITTTKRFLHSVAATLVDAEYTVELLIEAHGGSIDEWPDVSEDGGTIGPLPDGTTIVVEPKS